MKVLIVKLADLGDLLVSEPAIRSLRTAFPEAQIDLLTSPGAAGLAPLIDDSIRAITFEKSMYDQPGAAAVQAASSALRLGFRLARQRYDRVVVLHHLTTDWGAAKFRALAASARAPVVAGLDNGRGAFLTHRFADRGFGFMHESEYMQEVAIAAGGQRVLPAPKLKVPEQTCVEGLPGNYLAIAPKAGVFSPAREWPIDRYVTLARHLAERGHSTVIVGGADAADAGQSIAAIAPPGTVLNLAGKTTLSESAWVLQRAVAFIGNDSFPGHLAAAVGTPTVSIFGPSNHLAWAPGSGSREDMEGRTIAVVVRTPLPCSPCLYTGHRLGRPAGCSTRSCLEMVAPESVADAVQRLIGA